MAKYYIYNKYSDGDWELDYEATSQKDVREYLGIGPTTFKEALRHKLDLKPNHYLTPNLNGNIKTQITMQKYEPMKKEE